MVGPPKVINKKVNDKLLEPYEVIFLSFHQNAYLGMHMHFDGCTCTHTSTERRNIVLRITA